MQRKVGVLALQGGFEKHLEALLRIGIEGIKVKRTHELEMCDALILPGGESTTMQLFLDEMKLSRPLYHFCTSNAVFATCAGMILLAKMGLLHVALKRNAYGTQINSFSAPLQLSLAQEAVSFCGIFIRAPKIYSLLSEEVKVLAKHDGAAVLVEQGKILAMSFHPELTESSLVHEYFMKST